MKVVCFEEAQESKTIGKKIYVFIYKYRYVGVLENFEICVAFIECKINDCVPQNKKIFNTDINSNCYEHSIDFKNKQMRSAYKHINTHIYLW